MDNNYSDKPASNSQSSLNSLLHDVRNPLNTISINAELGKLILQRTGDAEKAIKIFDIILGECRNCSGKLGDLHAAMTSSSEPDRN